MYAVLFDIDGTLIQTGGAGQLAFAETFAGEFGVPAINKSVSFAGRSDRAIALDLMHAHEVAPSEANWQRFREGYLQRLPAALSRLEGCVLPGVVALLDVLAQLPQALVGLLTGNLRQGADRKLTHYGLDGRFAFGGFGDVATDRAVIAAVAEKEAERFAAQLKGAETTLCGTMVIGDTVHDIRCARAIGAVAVAVPTGGATADQLAAEGPDLLLDDLSHSAELIELIRRSR